MACGADGSQQVRVEGHLLPRPGVPGGGRAALPPIRLSVFTANGDTELWERELLRTKEDVLHQMLVYAYRQRERVADPHVLQEVAAALRTLTRQPLLPETQMLLAVGRRWQARLRPGGISADSLAIRAVFDGPAVADVGPSGVSSKRTSDLRRRRVQPRPNAVGQGHGNLGSQFPPIFPCGCQESVVGGLLVAAIAAESLPISVQDCGRPRRHFPDLDALRKPVLGDR